MNISKPAILLSAAGLLVGAALHTSAQSPDIARQAQVILDQHCVSCHKTGGLGQSVYILENRASLLKVVTPNDLNSKLLKSVAPGGDMPLAGAKLTTSEVAVLKKWVQAGAPDWASSPAPPPGTKTARPFLSESAILKLIQRDLEDQDERARPFLRYYSVAHLYNNPDLSGKDVEAYRQALSLLLNSLSWKSVISKPVPIDPARTLLRIDIRDFDWSAETWRTILAAYPYGIRYRDASASVIRDLSGADLPYIRADWFVANACLPPLYNEILSLPDTAAALERKLGVDAEQDLDQEKNVLRGGVRVSGVSNNNRAMERHDSTFGAYWKSFDYKSSTGVRDIFHDPIDLRPDAGELIFSLPNHLQAYFISDGAGKSLEAALTEIVVDHNNSHDVTVRNGRSCMGCHYQGMKPFTDGVRPAIDTSDHVVYDLDKAKAIYKGQDAIDTSLAHDAGLFKDAVALAGAQTGDSPAEEPILKLSLQFADDLTQNEAAAEAGLDVKTFIEKVKRSSKLDTLGFGQLLVEGGGMKRDEWEANFGAVVEELSLGDYVSPSHRAVAPSQAGDGVKTVSIGNLQGGDAAQVRAIRSALAGYLGQSPALRVVSGNGDVSLKGSLSVEAGGAATVSIGDAKSGLVEEETGSAGSLASLAERLANKISFRLTRNWLPPAFATVGPGASGGSAAPASDLTLPPPGSSPIGLALSVDRGADATYHEGDEVTIRFKADRDCFVSLYDVDPKGEITLLYPNPFARDNRAEANRIYSIPGASDPFRIRVRRNLGPEKVMGIATLAPLNGPGLDRVGASGDFVALGSDLSAVSKSLSVELTDKKDEGFSTASVRFFSAP